MRLIGDEIIEDFVRKHSDAKNWLERWMATVLEADWENLNDVRNVYPSADGVKLRNLIVVTVFNVKGNEYRLLTLIGYASQTTRVLEVMTHAEYDKNKWKERY